MIRGFNFVRRMSTGQAPSVKIYYLPESPPCRAVEMVADLAKVNLDKQYISLFSREHMQPENAKINPWRKIPMIIDGDLKINESRAIAAYLVNRYMPEDTTLYPRDPVKRARVDELLHMDHSFMALAMILLAPKMFGKTKELDAGMEKMFRNNLKYFESRLQSNKDKKFLIGDELTIGDISIAASFTFTEVNDYNISDFRALQAYLERTKAAIPKYHEINDEPIKNVKAFIKSLQENAS